MTYPSSLSNSANPHPPVGTLTLALLHYPDDPCDLLLPILRPPPTFRPIIVPALPPRCYLARPRHRRTLQPLPIPRPCLHERRLRYQRFRPPRTRPIPRSPRPYPL